MRGKQRCTNQCTTITFYYVDDNKIRQHEYPLLRYTLVMKLNGCLTPHHLGFTGNCTVCTYVVPMFHEKGT